MNTSTPLVSVAICTYNGERFIKEQLDSILNQTYTNLEIIITDDFSTDNTINIIEEYILNDDRITLFRNKKNLGFLKNFEKSISLCNGDFIALSDQDDIWVKDKISLFISEIKDNILIYSDAYLINEFTDVLDEKLIEGKKNLIKGKNNKAFLFNNCVSGNTLMFKKKLLNYILPIPESMNFHDTWIAFIASSIGTITYTTEPLVYYRRYQEQVTSNHKKKYKSFIEKYKSKKSASILSAKNSLFLYTQLSQIDFLDPDTKKLINLLKNHYENFENGFFNISLYKYLYSNKNTFFEIRKQQRRSNSIKKISMKLKFHKLLLFSN